jgi:hypothetical protein
MIAGSLKSILKISFKGHTRAAWHFGQRTHVSGLT